MPKVSQEHLVARRQQIVDAARRCFARSGFHRTTMQDVFRESGLSAGAVYRYFPSKAALVEAIADDVFRQIAQIGDELLGRDPLPTVEELILAVTRFAARQLEGPAGPGRLAIQVWGEAMVDERARTLVQDKYTIIRGVFVAYARKAIEAGRFPSESDPESVGAALFGLVPGFILQRALLDELTPDSYAAGLGAVLAEAVPFRTG